MTTYFLGGIVCPECQALRDGPLPPPGDKWVSLVNACVVEVCAKCRERHPATGERDQLDGQDVTSPDTVRAYALSRGYLRWYRPGERAIEPGAVLDGIAAREA